VITDRARASTLAGPGDRARGATTPHDTDDAAVRWQAHRLRALHAWFEPTFAGRCVERIVELQPFERALGLASRAFVAMLPLIIVASALSPAARHDGFADGLIDRFDLSGEGAAYVRQLFATPDQVRGSTNVVEIVVLLYAVFSFARLLARTYERAWRLPRAGFQGAFRGLVWVASVVGYIGVLVPLRTFATENTGTLVANGVVVLLSALVWLFTPYVLLAGRVRWQALVPTSVLTAIALGGTTLVGKVYLPHQFSTAGALYGLAGVSFTIVSWLIVLCIVILVAAAIGAVAGERWFTPQSTGEVRRSAAGGQTPGGALAVDDPACLAQEDE
jgi:membrane protein